jgi:hypothetical protein
MSLTIQSLDFGFKIIYDWLDPLAFNCFQIIFGISGLSMTTDYIVISICNGIRCFVEYFFHAILCMFSASAEFDE